MPKRKTHWEKKLSRRIKPKGGPSADLATLLDAARFILDLEEFRQRRPAWTYASDLLLRAAHSGKAADIQAATEQFLRALSVEGWL
jgi:hypothetical protein